MGLGKYWESDNPKKIPTQKFAHITEILYLCGVKRLLCILCACALMAGCAEILNPYEYAWMCYEEGKSLRETGDPVGAMQSFIKAEQNARSAYHLKGRVYSNVANMCRQAERHELAYDIYGLSTEQFRLANDSLAVAYALNNMAWEQAVMGHKDTALWLVDSALTVCPSEAVQTKVMESRAAACLYAAEYDSAVYYAQQIADTLYSEMLLAQAFALTNCCDSALVYAFRVTERTDNPRYLDDTYYIIAHCDSTAERPEVVALTEKRADVQRDLEHYKTEMAQAVMIWQQSRERHIRHPWCLVLLILVALSVIAWLVFRWRRFSKRRQLARLSAQLMQSADPKKDIPWDIYDLPSKLQERGFSEREVRIAILVLFGFTYAQMANILNRAENGIGKDKYLIAKKLGVSVKDLRTTLCEIACRS